MNNIYSSITGNARSAPDVPQRCKDGEIVFNEGDINKFFIFTGGHDSQVGICPRPEYAVLVHFDNVRLYVNLFEIQENEIYHRKTVTHAHNIVEDDFGEPNLTKYDDYHVVACSRYSDGASAMYMIEISNIGPDMTATITQSTTLHSIIGASEASISQLKSLREESNYFIYTTATNKDLTQIQVFAALVVWTGTQFNIVDTIESVIHSGDQLGISQSAPVDTSTITLNFVEWNNPGASYYGISLWYDFDVNSFNWSDSTFLYKIDNLTPKEGIPYLHELNIIQECPERRYYALCTPGYDPNGTFKQIFAIGSANFLDSYWEEKEINFAGYEDELRVTWQGPVSSPNGIDFHILTTDKKTPQNLYLNHLQVNYNQIFSGNYDSNGIYLINRVPLTEGNVYDTHFWATPLDPYRTLIGVYDNSTGIEFYIYG